MSVIPAKLVPAEAGSRNPVISHKYNLPPIIENLPFGGLFFFFGDFGIFFAVGIGCCGLKKFRIFCKKKLSYRR